MIAAYIENNLSTLVDDADMLRKLHTVTKSTGRLISN